MKNTEGQDYLACYPFTLAMAIFGGDEESARRINAPDLIAATETLTDRERDILERRYRDGETQEMCGRAYAVTRERIRQVEAKAIWSLRNPARMRMYYSGAWTAGETNEPRYTVAELKELTRKVLDFIDVAKTAEIPEEDDEEDELPKAAPSVEEMELSVRSYNCLVRAGVRNAAEAANLTWDELLSMHNMGVNSAKEVKRKLEALGYSLRKEGNNG